MNNLTLPISNVHTLSLPSSYVSTKSAIEDILFLGSHTSLVATEFFADVDLSTVVNITTIERVLQTLNFRVANGYSAPKAIICELDFWKKHQKSISKSLCQHVLFQNIPFILLSPGEEIDKVAALKAGVDDCYLYPFNMVHVYNRINFLNWFKGAVATYKNQARSFEVKIPVWKRTIDIMIAAMALLLLSPLLILVAIGIKLESPGPIIYRSKRVGTGYQIFDFLKFRSMRVDADAMLKELKHLNQYSDDGKPTFIKIANDPRITSIGRFIRNTSIDELPQLFNVLKGDMSIVGNRPLPIYEAEQLTKDVWAKRFLAPAGITGLWQVTKRGNKNMSTIERLTLDNTYAEKSSFWFDLSIILRTIPAMWQQENV